MLNALSPNIVFMCFNEQPRKLYKSRKWSWLPLLISTPILALAFARHWLDWDLSIKVYLKTNTIFDSLSLLASRRVLSIYTQPLLYFNILCPVKLVLPSKLLLERTALESWKRTQSKSFLIHRISKKPLYIWS